MRTPKYRAWHKTMKEMMPVYQLVWKAKKKPRHIVTNKGWIRWNDNVVLLEFTGLVDKTGEEIYEGDILKTDWYGNKPEHYHVVEYGNCGGYDNWSMGFDMPEMGRDEGELEIVGNIYENSELLEPVVLGEQTAVRPAFT